MGFTEDMTCKDCGRTFSCLFGTDKSASKNFDETFKNEYGEKAYEQLNDILNKIKNDDDVNIDEYNCFSEIKYDLEFKTKYLKKKLHGLEEQIAIQDKERKNENSKFKFVAETFYWMYVQGFNELKEILDSGDVEAINQAFSEKWVLFKGKRSGYTLFKCPKCNRYEGGFFTNIETADGKYECNYICSDCNTTMDVYNGCLSDGVEKKELSCKYCGSDNVVVKIVE